MAVAPNRRQALGALSAGGLLAAPAAQAATSGPAVTVAPIDPAAIDGVVSGFMRLFEIPGLAVAVVQPGQAPIVRGYGVRVLGQAAQVDADTQFAIASNSKAFLTACLALLVDAGKLGWDDLVVDHLPDFRMSDPRVTSMMTVRDLLTHRSGLPLGAGDLLQFPRTDHTAEDVLKALPYFKPARGFRAGYAYDNSLYIVAGLLLQRVSGLGWDDFVRTRIFQPLGMTQAVSNPTMRLSPNHAGRHARLGPPVIGMGPVQVIPADEGAIIGPAGGIAVSAAQIVPWLQVQLGRGALPDGRRLWSEAQADELWKPQTIVSSSAGPTAEAPQRAVIAAYALGWGVADYRGRRMLSHGGGLAGQITRTALLPEQGVGLAVFSNSQEEDAVSALRYALADRLLGAPAFDWVGFALNARDKAEAEVRKVLAADGAFAPPPGGPSLALERYAGRYRDPWYGDIVVSRRGAGLAIAFTHTPVFTSVLEPFGPDAFRTRFPATAGEDAVVTFAVHDGAVTGVTMRPLSPLADFSFDFQDLAFAPVRD
ncbi:serine hydrolase [Caulobacter sp. KR2-114]|uniref:serine hydrolase n=1 Tax=Caulobacter sp. KR2-114 TaxID=3400912 RepID=UPI003BFE7A43